MGEKASAEHEVEQTAAKASEEPQVVGEQQVEKAVEEPLVVEDPMAEPKAVEKAVEEQQSMTRPNPQHNL